MYKCSYTPLQNMHSKVVFFLIYRYTHPYCLVGCLSILVWTHTVLGFLYACVLYFCICTCSAQLKRRSRNTIIIIIIIIIIKVLCKHPIYNKNTSFCLFSLQNCAQRKTTCKRPHLHPVYPPPPLRASARNERKTIN